MTSSPRVLLTGTIGSTPHLGGLSWVALNQLFGLEQAGCDVHLVEPLRASERVPADAPLGSSDNAAYFRAVLHAHGIADRATLLCTDTRTTVGRPYDELVRVAASADVVLNVGGLLDDPELLGPAPVRAYLDLDPGFTQLWAAQGADLRLDGHTHFVTVGSLLGSAQCPVPTLGRHWIGMLPPVSLPHWPTVEPAPREAPFTTVASWRGYGSVWHEGVHYGQKAHAMRPLFGLTERTSERLEPALEIHPDEVDDVAALARHGWKLHDPARVANTPQAFRRFVHDSRAELGIAKLGYIVGRTGWFSDRSVCYLAAGRPVLAHDTGFDQILPTGEGLLAFSDVDDAAHGIAEIAGDPGKHGAAARRIAEEHFDARTVMADLIERVGSR